MGTIHSSLSTEDIANLQSITCFSAFELRELYQRFERLDRDHSGTLSVEELLSVPEFTMNPLAPRLIEILNLNEEELDFTNFVRLLSVFHSKCKVSEKLKCTPSLPSPFLTTVFFQLYNIGGDGLIKKAELLHVLRLMAGEHLEESHLVSIVDETFQEVDTNGDDLIDFQEFVAVPFAALSICPNLPINLDYNKE